MPLSDTSLGVTLKSTQTSTLDLGTGTFPLNFGHTIALANGTGASQADRMYQDTDTIAASGTRDLDLAGALTDVFGVALTFVKVKVIVVRAAAANVNNVVVGAAAATQFVGPFGAATHTVAVAPGGIFVIARADATAWSVGAGASDLLRFTNSAGGTSVIYDVIIIGTSA